MSTGTLNVQRSNELSPLNCDLVSMTTENMIGHCERAWRLVSMTTANMIGRCERPCRLVMPTASMIGDYQHDYSEL